MKIKFGGLTYVHMGLFEYFTALLNDSPVVGECVLPTKLVRNVSLPYQYPFDDSLYLDYTFELLKESYHNELIDSSRNISKYIQLSMEVYKDYLKTKIDNHRSALVITNTLWRIREKLGRVQTDELIANTIIHLNTNLTNRPKSYSDGNDKANQHRINWYDLYMGLLDQDEKLHTMVRTNR